MGRYPIDRKERVTLGGLGQTIHIWGTKNENPVILFLHGGPGVPNRHDMAKDGFGLTDDFTVVAWDQRGTGGSYFGCDPESLTLEQVGPPVNGQYKPVFEGLMTQRRILGKYGGHTVKKESYFKGTVLPMLLSTELSIKDKYGAAKGYKLCLTQMWSTLVNYDFTTQLHTFEMPYYIFQGRRDENTPAALIQNYYDSIEAPDKDLIWFENSAHRPLSEEPELFRKHLREKFLKIAGDGGRREKQ